MNRFTLFMVPAVAFVILFSFTSIVLADSTKDNGRGQGDKNRNPVAGHVEDESFVDNEDENDNTHGLKLGPRLQMWLNASSTASTTPHWGKDVAKEVKKTLEDHASSSERSLHAIEKVQKRPIWMIFLIGTDFKNLGALRSELAHTQNDTRRLERVLASTTDPVVQAEIQAQIDAIADNASTTTAFLEEHEDTFSLFGWFFKFFSR